MNYTTWGRELSVDWARDLGNGNISRGSRRELGEGRGAGVLVTTQPGAGAASRTRLHETLLFFSRQVKDGALIRELFRARMNSPACSARKLQYDSLRRRTA